MGLFFDKDLTEADHLVREKPYRQSVLNGIKAGREDAKKTVDKFKTRIDTAKATYTEGNLILSDEEKFFIPGYLSHPPHSATVQNIEDIGKFIYVSSSIFHFEIERYPFGFGGYLGFFEGLLEFEPIFILFIDTYYAIEPIVVLKKAKVEWFNIIKKRFREALTKLSSKGLTPVRKQRLEAILKVLE